MEQLNMNQELGREKVVAAFAQFLNGFDKARDDLTRKRGLYLYGDPGSGKSWFVSSVLKDLGYDVISYDAGDIRNKAVIEGITKHNMSDSNVLSMLQRRVKKIAVVMDEIDGMNNGDKGGINALIKLIRPKKTKKQKLEEVTPTPIICIGNYHVDKKIKELMKVCVLVELPRATAEQTRSLVGKVMKGIDPSLLDRIAAHIGSDLRKMSQFFRLNKERRDLISSEVLDDILHEKSFNEDTKQIVRKLFLTPHSIDKHSQIMNETDRTIVGLLWHENIIDILSKSSRDDSIPFYTKALENICFADYIDRVTFQKQIWQFNEISSLLKTFYNNYLFHRDFNRRKLKPPAGEMRFTKVLTKYSTEYNNGLFVQTLCQTLSLDKKDMFGLFETMRENHSMEEITQELEHLDIAKLDVDRIYRFIDNKKAPVRSLDETKE
jgi:replication factor C subunit 1